VFTLFYYTLATIFYIVALPFLLFFTFKKKYRASIPARFFLYHNPPLKKDGVWFHVCSLGEAKSIKPIINALDKNLLRCSAITNTGFSEIKKYTSEARYLPYEIFLPFWIKRQKALVVVEAELWYMLFLIVKVKGAKTFLINARISQRSYPKYLKFRWFYKRIFQHIDRVYAQSKEDAKRLEALGAKNIQITGNIKLASIPKPTKAYQKPANLIVTAASTHEREEELIIKAFLDLKKIKKDAKLIVVPRHPERFERVQKLLEAFAKEHKLSFSSFSKSKDFKSDIILVDMLGELINIYTISDIVILGGSFEKIGGHNAAEAAQFGCKIISGEHYFTQKDIFRAIENIKITKKEDLSKTLINYQNLLPSKLKTNVTLDNIIKDIKSVL